MSLQWNIIAIIIIWLLWKKKNLKIIFSNWRTNFPCVQSLHNQQSHTKFPIIDLSRLFLNNNITYTFIIPFKELLYILSIAKVFINFLFSLWWKVPSCTLLLRVCVFSDVGKLLKWHRERIDSPLPQCAHLYWHRYNRKRARLVTMVIENNVFPIGGLSRVANGRVDVPHWKRNLLTIERGVIPIPLPPSELRHCANSRPVACCWMKGRTLLSRQGLSHFCQHTHTHTRLFIKSLLFCATR